MMDSRENETKGFIGWCKDHSERVLARYFRLIPVPESLRALSFSTSKVVVVARGHSLVLRALLLSFAERLGLESATELTAHTSIQNLSWSNSLHYTSVHSQDALGLLASSVDSVQFSTLSIFRSRGPIHHNPRYELSLLDNAALLFRALLRGRFLLILFSPPMAITSLNLSSGRRLSRALKLEFYRNLKLVRGTPFQAIETQRRTVLGGKEYEADLTEIAAELDLSFDTAHGRAVRAFNTIAARPRTWMYYPASIIARFITNRLFTQVTTRGMENFRAAARKSTVVLIPTHRSHLDYILLGYKLYESDLNPPLVAAGVNLSFWPFGFIIRSLGGYFVKRNARTDKVHALVLRRYVRYLIKRGHLQEFFIEGGRSRSGRMRPPKLGLLSTIASAYTHGLRKDVFLVPVSITYESLIENKVFAKEDTGEGKKGEDLRGVLRALRIFKNKYGEVVISFGEPVSLADYFPQREAVPSVESEPVSDLAHLITREIRAESSISLAGLTHTALFLSPNYGLTESQLHRTVRNLLQIIEVLDDIDGCSSDHTPSLQSYLEHSNPKDLDLFQEGIVDRGLFDNENFYFIRGRNRYAANFYKNSTVHLFVPLSLISLTYLTDKEIEVERVKSVYIPFKDDYLLEQWPEFSRRLTLLIGSLEQKGVLAKEQGRLVFTTEDRGLYMPNLLLGTLQCHLWVLHSLLFAPTSADAPVLPTDSLKIQPIPYDLFLRSLSKNAKLASYAGILTRTEATAQSAVSSCIAALRKQKLVEVTDYPQEGRQIYACSGALQAWETLQALNRSILGWLSGRTGTRTQ